MVNTEYYPLKRMNANHKRFDYLCQGLSENYNVLVICPNDSLRIENAEVGHVKVMRIPAVSLSLLSRPAFKILSKIYLRKLLKDIDPGSQLVYWYNSVLAPFNFKGKPTLNIWDIMGLDSVEILRDSRTITKYIKSGIFKVLENKAFKNTTFITTINNSHKKIIRQNFSGKIEILRDAVDEKELANIDEGFSKDLSEKFSNKFKIIFIGSFDRMRIDDLMNVFPELRAVFRNIQVIVAGDGVYLPKYKEMAKLTGVENNIHFTGYLNKGQINALIRLSDICFADVFLEGFPFKVFEYGLFGKPIVVKATPSIKEVLTDNETACLYENEDQLKDCIRNLHDNTDFRDTIGRNIHNDIVLKHTWVKRIQQLTDLINS
jgi:glycosyltransferase involved in cell wall biosynthesis